MPKEIDSDLQVFTIVLEVDALPGEQNLSVSKVSGTDMMVLDPILLDIKERHGYYPKVNPAALRELYRKYVGWSVLESILPKPRSGYTTITGVRVFSELPLTLNMF